MAKYILLFAVCTLVTLCACHSDYIVLPSVQLCMQDHRPTDRYYLYDQDNVQLGQQVFLPQYSVGLPIFGPQVTSNMTLIAKLHNNENFNASRKLTIQKASATKSTIDYYAAVSAASTELSERVTLVDLRESTVLKEVSAPRGHVALPSFYVHVVDEQRLYKWFDLEDTRQTASLPTLWSFVSPFVADQSRDAHVSLQLTPRHFAVNFHLFELQATDLALDPRVAEHSMRGLVTSVQYGHRCIVAVNTTLLLPNLEMLKADFSEISKAMQTAVAALLEQRTEFLQSFEERFPRTVFDVAVTCSPFMPLVKGEEHEDEHEKEPHDELEADDELAAVIEQVRSTATATSGPSLMYAQNSGHNATDTTEQTSDVELALSAINATEMIRRLEAWMSRRVKVEQLTELFDSAVPLSIAVKRLVRTSDYAAVPHELVFESECMHVLAQAPVSLLLLTSVTQLTVFALFLAVLLFVATVLLTVGNMIHMLKHFYGHRIPFVRVHESFVHVRLPYVSLRMYEENEGFSASSGGN